MAMIKCKKCGKEISDQAAFCPNCGCPVTNDAFSTVKEEHANSKQTNPTRISDLINDQTSLYQNSKPVHDTHEGKNSKLGVLALIFSILGCTFIIGIILSIIDLCKKDGKKKVCSIIALIISFLWIVIGIATSSSSDSGKNNASNQSSNVSTVSTDQTIEEKEKPVSSLGNVSDSVISSITYIPVTADELSSALTDNAMKAQNDYKDQYLEITGKLGNIDSNGKYIGIDTDTFSLTNIQCYIKTDEQKEIIIGLSKGDSIVVKGYCKDIGEIIGYQIDIDSIEFLGVESDEFSNLTPGQENALKTAKSYLEYSAFSYQGLINQLVYEKYSTDDATFAADNCGADWNEQAAKSAKSYLEYSSFSRDGLIEQLEYEGFTHDQAIYGVEANGY